MAGRRLRLNPGPSEITLEGSEAGCSGGVLWLYVRDMSLAQTYAVVSDPANTAVIVFEYGEMADRYEGYTRLTGLMARDDLTAVSLEREASADV